MTPQELKAQKVALLEALPGVVLDRGEAVPKLIGRHEDFLIVAGLGGTAHDVGAVTGDKRARVSARRRDGRAPA